MLANDPTETIRPGSFQPVPPSLPVPDPYGRITVELPLPQGGFTGCENVGINDRGDMVGDCWSDTEDLPARWSTKDLTFSEIISFPVDWGFAWDVNDNRIAAITYTGGEKCSAGVPWVYTCGGAIQLH